MTVVFVHGNPETAAIWDPLIAELGRSDVVAHDDVVALSPPGFGAPVPAGFGATAGEYCDWLIAELERLGGPVDLVGHDWGAGHVIGVVMRRRDLVRTWCIDVMGITHPDYVWHEAAQAWQTEGVGEEMVQAMVAASPEAETERYESLGIPAESARVLASAIDDDMGRCILALYRSAAQPALRNLGENVEAMAARPGLVIIAADDHYVGTEEMARAGAVRAGAEVRLLGGVGHWWMLQDPASGAAALADFWGER